MDVSSYLSEVNKQFLTGIAKEHAYRGYLKNLLESILPGVIATNEPKRIDCGSPDYVLTREGKEIPIGYIEAKDIGEPLEGKKHKEQFDRYRDALSNLIITDYLDFHFYREGERTVSIRVAEVKDGKINPLPESFETFTSYIKDFAIFIGQSIKSPEKLAKMMAGKARLLANIIHNALDSDEESSANNDLYAQYEGFRQVLIHDIDTKAFADIYAQTVAYGMFAARLHDPTLPTFSREEAAKLIPTSNPFLRKLFQYIAANDLDDRIVWIVDSLVEVFLATNVAALMEQHGKGTKRHDPVIHFYETFLAEYDPKLRKARGVWYTPEPVVKFIVRAVDGILKTEFGLSEGLADSSKTTIKVDMPVVRGRGKDRATRIEKVEREVHRVQILDPSCGTGTFLAEAVRHIYEDFESMPGIWPQYVRDDLIPRLHGFELLMASYAMAHLKMDMLLRETGYEAKGDQRFNIFLTNALEEHHPDTATLFASWLSDEAQSANYIKRDTPVMVVIGNPPYSGHSANRGKWIASLLTDYKQEPGGGKLKERNSKWLNDDYVKFIRYGQFFVERNHEGVLAYISNNGFLDNPTFRGMRWHLLTTFDKIFVINLHGSVKKKDGNFDENKDENVFDIEQGVSINLFVKTGRKKKGQLAKLFYYSVHGSRKKKYKLLAESALDAFEFKNIDLRSPSYLFTQFETKGQSVYEKGFSLKELFVVQSIGIATARDSFCIKFSENEVKKLVGDFSLMQIEDAREKYQLGKDVRDWKVEWAKADLLKSNIDENKVEKIFYRPFDERYTYYTGNSRGFHCMPRNDVMQHLVSGENIGICFNRRVEENRRFTDVFLFKGIVQLHSLSIKEANSIAPIFVSKEGICGEKIANFNDEIITKISRIIKVPFSLEMSNNKESFSALDVVDYIYSILHSPAYREKYNEFLCSDYPRIPYPDNVNMFWNLVQLGNELRQVHLLESVLLNKAITSYPKVGDNTVTRKILSKDWELYDVDRSLGRIWINDEQYFDQIPLLAWEFYIGGYQPAQKWLKDRTGRVLTRDDIRHYQKIIVALKETDRLMQELDKVWTP
ncbi:type ISP restriction/modification enzyme [Thiothrix nivea]|uniref:site-specific DNA-methyltransferase (adenine-specific) n=1 Tax=Thiothrix nivea (strain ATCC 35100 / DSM 5205 / JP2) TaxID=870187 RepID=A0A656HFQ7_THINJ|nr:type ISP restriction/modification enzyme [Thiothrix nivea]EIJ35287.1 adenine specific DNA methyltransferase [Thiothrix nivea DSM 5205]